MIVGVAGAPVDVWYVSTTLPLVDQREHLARDVGLDVVAGIRVAGLERALAASTF